MNDPKVQKAVKEAAEKTGKDAISALQDPEATNSVNLCVGKSRRDLKPVVALQLILRFISFQRLNSFFLVQQLHRATRFDYGQWEGIVRPLK